MTLLIFWKLFTNEFEIKYFNSHIRIYQESLHIMVSLTYTKFLKQIAYYSTILLLNSVEFKMFSTGEKNLSSIFTFTIL